MHRNPALEAALALKPDDVSCHQVYADWLMEQGDPLGELIATSLAAEREPKRQRKLKLRAAKLLDEYTAALVERYPRAMDAATVEWRRGLPRSVVVYGLRGGAAAESWKLVTDPICQFLDYLLIREQRIPDLAAIARLRCLTLLNLFHSTGVTDVSALAGHPRLRVLNLTGTGITDLTPLTKLPSLCQLYLKETKVTDLRPLAGIKTLQFVSIEDAPVADVSPLFDLPLLWEVWAYKTRVPPAQLRELSERMDARPRHDPAPGLSLMRIVYGAP